MVTETNKSIRVFVSYGREDKTWRQDIVGFLIKEGFQAIFDEGEIELGTNWRVSLKNMLDSSSAMLVLFTENSVKNPWVLYECIYAIAKGKLVIFLAKDQSVKVPDPISDLQGVFLDVERHTELMERVAHTLKKGRVSEQTERRKSTVIDDEEVLTFLINRYVELGAKKIHDGVQDISEIEQTINDMKSFDYTNDTYLKVIQNQIYTKGIKLGEHFANPPQFEDMHRAQAIRGELLSQLLDQNPQYFFQWTNPFKVGSKTLIASKYLLTRGLYYVGFRGDKAIGIGGSGGLPQLFQVDNMKKGEENEENLLFQLDKLREWITEQLHHIKVHPKDVRVPTIAEWIALAQPSSQWDALQLSGCNLVSRAITGKERVSVVGTYPMSRSKEGCFDVIGNTWELCKDGEDWCVMGCSYKNTLRDASRNWAKPISVLGKALGEPVGLRFIAEM